MICNFAPKSRVCSLIDKVPNISGEQKWRGFMSVWVVVTKIMTFFSKMRACRSSPAGLCITINSTGFGLVALAGNGL